MTALTYEADTRAADTTPYKAVNPNHPRLAVKHGSVFLLMDTQGMVPAGIQQGFGLFKDDTRWLSRWEMTLNGDRPFMLNSTVSDGYACGFVYSNEEIDGAPSTRNIMIERNVVIADQLTERIVVQNFNASPAEIEIAIEFGCDFADMFEVRGANRKQRGVQMVPVASPDRRRIVLAYKGRDELLRETFIDFLRLRPSELTESKAIFRIKLNRQERREILIHVGTRVGGSDAAMPGRPMLTYEQERAIADARYSGWMGYNARIASGNVKFNEILARAYNDIYILRQEGSRGTALAAGVPWFSVPFGRDDFITALQTIAFMPELAREVLLFFSRWQGTKFDSETGEEPGKMPHEIRTGEMANCAEIAFRPSYHTIDATQLWLMLLGEYVRWTGDLDLAREIWVQVEAAEQFCGRRTADGANYMIYGDRPGEALANQGWKDSWNSVVYSDGQQALPPIALCEPQGYLYAGWTAVAEVAEQLGKSDYATALRQKAAVLKGRFERDFWMEDKEFIALALDGKGRQCDVISSNPGHLIGTGILSSEKELLVAQRMMEPDMFCQGFRTLASSEVAYQPLDYQVGAVWPHDSAFTAAQLPRIGKPEYAHAVMEGLFEAALHQAALRLPELFCGVTRPGTSDPVRYPVACVPQAWSSGCWFQMLKGCFDIIPDAVNMRVRIAKPSLPIWLGKVSVTGLRIGDAELDLEFYPGKRGKTRCLVTRLVGDLAVVIDD